jgi:hypothetical protein
MLRILGSARQLCQGLSRRDMLRVGGLGLGGLSLPQILSLQEASAAAPVDRERSFGKAKSLILIHLYGSPSQLEWVDCKPDAPVEVRGELKTIPSTLKGCDVCELFPNMAKVMDRTTVIRSLTHPYPIHGVAFALTGVPVIDVGMELSPHDPKHWPYFGSVVEYVDSRRRQGEPVVPSNIALPFPFSTKRVGEVHRAGPYAAFLGSQFDPLWADFQGTATKGITKPCGHDLHGQRPVHRHWAGQLLRRAQRVEPAARVDARSAEHAQVAAGTIERQYFRSGSDGARPFADETPAVGLVAAGIPQAFRGA